MRPAREWNTRIVAAKNLRKHINGFLGLLHQNDVCVFGPDNGEDVFNGCAIPAQKVPAQNLEWCARRQ